MYFMEILTLHQYKVVLFVSNVFVRSRWSVEMNSLFKPWVLFSFNCAQIILLFIARFLVQVKPCFIKSFVYLFSLQICLKVQYAISNVFPVGSRNQTKTISALDDVDDYVIQRVLVMSTWEEGLAVRANSVRLRENNLAIQEKPIGK